MSVLIYKEVKISEIPYLAFRSVYISAPVMFIIGVYTELGRLIAITQMPIKIADLILSITSSTILRNRFCHSPGGRKLVHGQ